METRWSLRHATSGVALGLLVTVLGGCGTAQGPQATPGGTSGTSTTTTASSPTLPPPSIARTPPSPLGTPELDTPAPNGGPGAACAGWAISITPDASGAKDTTGAIEAYLREHPDYSTTPAWEWLQTWPVPTPAPDMSVTSISAHAGGASLVLAHLEDGTWLAVSGMRC